MIPPGKLPPELLARLLDEPKSLPAEILVGPSVGEDGCAIDVEGTVLIAATDPITFTGASPGRAAVIVNANDVAVMGARPRWFLSTLLLPPGATEHDAAELFAGMREALGEVGAYLVGGHTEVTGAVKQAVVVGHMLGIVESGGPISTAGLSAGDLVLQVGPVPVEGGAVLAAAVGGELARRVRDAFAAAVDAGVPGLSVVRPALAAAGLGATAMHDPTEGGLAGGLWELARAGGVGLRVDPSRVVWFAPGLEVCATLGADPWATLASGCLLAAFGPERAAEAAADLKRQGHEVGVIATAEAGSGVYDRSGEVIREPPFDEVARLLGPH
jgi:hydrogenase maturation factor